MVAQVVRVYVVLVKAELVVKAAARLNIALVVLGSLQVEL